MKIRRQPIVEHSIIEWFASLPFVCELPRTFGSASTRRLAVYCAPLGISQLCVIIQQSQRRSRGPRLYVVMPGRMKAMAVLTGWFASIAPMDDGRLKCLVEYEGRDRAELEVILGSAYSFTFPAVVAS
jgi:hypothetical protein